MIDYESGMVSKAATNEQLHQLSVLVELQKNLEKQVINLEEQLTRVNKKLRLVSEVDIPELLDEVGIASISLRDGSSVEVKDVMTASIPKKNKPAASTWLIANGQAALVKNDVVIPFDVGDNAKVAALLELLDASGYSTYHVKKDINTARVKVAIKELLADGKKVPLRLFGAHVIRTTIIK